MTNKFRKKNPPFPQVSGAFACGTIGLPFEPPMRGHSYVEEISSAAMLTTKRLAGVKPQVNLRERVLRQARNPEEMSPEVQNRGIIGPQKWTCVQQKFLKKDSARWFLSGFFL